MNRKAQGEIITTVLIILLVLAAIVIVWQAVRGTVTKSTESIGPKVACIDVGLSIAGSSAAGDNVTITRGAGGDDNAVSNVTILVNGAVVKQTGPADDSLTQMQTKTYTGVALSSGDKIQVAAVLNDGTVCNIVDASTAGK